MRESHDQYVFGTQAKQKLLMLQISTHKLKVFISINTVKVLSITAMAVR